LSFRPSHLQMQLLFFFFPFTNPPWFVVPFLIYKCGPVYQSSSFTNTARFVVPPSLPIYKCSTICWSSSFTNTARFVVSPSLPIYKCGFIFFSFPFHLQIQPGLSFPLVFIDSHLQMRPCLSILFIYKYSQVCRSLFSFSSHLQMRYHLLILFIYKYSQVCRSPLRLSILIYKCGPVYWSSSFTNTARFVVPPSLPIYKCGFIFFSFPFTNPAWFVIPPSPPIYKCGTIWWSLHSHLSFPLLFPFTNVVPFVNPNYKFVHPATVYWSSSFTNTTRFVVPPSPPIYKGGIICWSLHSQIQPPTNAAPSVDPNIRSSIITPLSATFSEYIYQWHSTMTFALNPSITSNSFRHFSHHKLQRFTMASRIAACRYAYAIWPSCLTDCVIISA